MKLFTLSRFLIFLVSISAYNCASVPQYRDVHLASKSLLDTAEDHIKEKRYSEATELLRTVLKVYPEDSRANSISEKLPDPYKAGLRDISLKGFNKANRTEADSGFFEKLAWYLPDRILDFLDIASFNVKIGPQLGASLWAFRGFQVTLYAGNTMQLGWFQKRTLGFTEELSGEAGLGPIVPIAISGRSIGTGSERGIYDSFVLHSPYKKVYQDYRDYWSTGAKVGFLLTGAEVELHWLEIFDFISGIFTFDPLEDDFGKTRSLLLSKQEQKNLLIINTASHAYCDCEIREIRGQFPSLSDAPENPVLPKAEEASKSNHGARKK
ncbi:hypothetical protein [Leptospira inadai]|uniref:hypothetical protein n=1 Tax=Leptospira inadai TaxID=29506 RepID=UPI001EE26C93|nr:hypothetical protein [Leptospira inadai]